MHVFETIINSILIYKYYKITNCK